MSEKQQNRASSTGLIAAIAASSCCIAPVVAAIAGIGSFSASLSWIEPLRPYLIGFAVLAIGYAWYINLKPKAEDNCGCEVERKPRFYEGRPFLIGITLFAMLSIGFPSYSHYLLPAQEVHVAAGGDFTTVKLDVTGMTCTGCEVHVNTASSEVNGVKSATSDYENESAVIVFDPAITDVEQISDHIEKETGYSVRKAKK